MDGDHATGEREPNLATLVRICGVLAATPNDLLLPEAKPPAQSGRERVLARISAAIDQLNLADLELAACQIECLTAHRPTRRQRVQGRAATGLDIIAKSGRCWRLSLGRSGGRR
jgi:hypothetical protein